MFDSVTVRECRKSLPRSYDSAPSKASSACVGRRAQPRSLRDRREVPEPRPRRVEARRHPAAAASAEGARSAARGPRRSVNKLFAGEGRHPGGTQGLRFSCGSQRCEPWEAMLTRSLAGASLRSEGFGPFGRRRATLSSVVVRIFILWSHWSTALHHRAVDSETLQVGGLSESTITGWTGRGAPADLPSHTPPPLGISCRHPQFARLPGFLVSRGRAPRDGIIDRR